MADKEIRYRDLSTPLKVLVWLSWIVISFFLLSFMLAFIEGFFLGYTSV